MMEGIITLLLKLLGFLPFTALQRVGRCVGILFNYFPNDIRRISQLNIAHCLPELSAPERRRLTEVSLQHAGMSLFEMMGLWTKKPSTILRSMHNIDRFPKLSDHPNGIIFLLPHVGAWEAFTVITARLYPVVALYRPQKSPILDKIIRKAREREGMALVPTNAQGVRALYQALAKQKVVGILPDQDPGESGGVFAPFFQHPANTMTLAARLAHKTQAQVFFLYAERLNIGKGFISHIIPADLTFYTDDLYTATTAMNRQIETIIRSMPEQYQWSYKRFKRLPDGQPNIYDQHPST